MESTSVFQTLQTTVTGLTLARENMEAKRRCHGPLCATCANYYGPVDVCDMRLEETHGKMVQCNKYRPER